MSKLNLGDSLILDSDIVVNGGEVKTGATFDGKPVYAECKEWTGSQYSIDNYFLFSIGTAINEVVDIKVLQYLGTDWCNNNAVYLPSSTFSCILASLSSNKLNFRVNIRYSSNQPLTKVRATVFYTKTTD